MEDSEKLDDIMETLNSINKRLECLEEEAKWNHKQWKENQSFGHYMKRWGGFYVANLMSDEKLGLNGNNSVCGVGSKWT